MKARLDENLALRIATRLRDLGHDVHTTEQENLSGCSDSELWTRAEREGRTVITQDLDFSGSPSLHAGYRSRCRAGAAAGSEPHAFQPAMEVFQTEALSEWQGSFVVVTDQKSRCDGSQTNLEITARKRLLSRPHRRDHQRTGGSFLGVAFVVLIEQRESAFAGCGCSRKFRS
jgi:hypothetical protein